MDYTDYVPTYLAAAATTQILTGKGMLHAIVIGETTAGAITLLDGTAASSTTFAVLKASIAEGTYRFDCSVSNGLRITAAGNTKFTVVWAKP